MQWVRVRVKVTVRVRVSVSCAFSEAFCRNSGCRNSGLYRVQEAENNTVIDIATPIEIGRSCPKKENDEVVRTSAASVARLQSSHLLTTSCAGGHHNMPTPPRKFTFDLESVVRVTCDVGYVPLCQF